MTTNADQQHRSGRVVLGDHAETNAAACHTRSNSRRRVKLGRRCKHGCVGQAGAVPTFRLRDALAHSDHRFRGSPCMRRRTSCLDARATSRLRPVRHAAQACQALKASRFAACLSTTWRAPARAPTALHAMQSKCKTCGTTLPAAVTDAQLYSTGTAAFLGGKALCVQQHRASGLLKAPTARCHTSWSAGMTLASRCA